MRLCHYGKDGGPYSTVWGFFLIEIKSLFTVVLLRFEDGSREAYHSHAFNCFSWLLSGKLEENFRGKTRRKYYLPSWLPFTTKRDTFHRVVSTKTSWVLSFRGPWAKTWEEYLPEENRYVTLGSGRKELT